MTLDDNCVHPLTTPFAPFAFAGEAKVAVNLVDGPTRDFNLMVRREYVRGEIMVWRGSGAYDPDSSTVLVYCACGEIDSAEGPAARRRCVAAFVGEPGQTASAPRCTGAGRPDRAIRHLTEAGSRLYSAHPSARYPPCPY
jgi:Uncharacterized protein conserved in bacteria